MSMATAMVVPKQSINDRLILTKQQAAGTSFTDKPIHGYIHFVMGILQNVNFEEINEYVPK